MTAHTLLTGGRPKNIYKMAPAELAKLLSGSHHTEPMQALEQERGFGTVGYAQTKTGGHLARLTIIPTGLDGRFFWTRLQTPDGKLEFAFPAVVDRERLMDLIEMWEFDLGVKWFEGPVASPFFPASWTFPMPFVRADQRFYVLVFDETTRHHSLHLRGGIHAIRGGFSRIGNQVPHCAGIVGEESPWLLMRVGNRLPPNARIPSPGDPHVSPQLLEMLWQFSSAYFNDLILKPADGHAHGVVPHWDIINLPLPSVTPFSLVRR